MYRGAETQHQGVHFIQVLMLELMREALRKGFVSLMQADLAVKEGKALEQFRERTVGLYGIEEMRMEEPARERDTADVKVSLIVSRVLTPPQEFRIRHTLDEVNQRFGTRIQATIVPGQNGSIA